jgi:drug/metabolite transporter (DMT)-like permease
VSWIHAALVSAAIMAVVSVLDSHLVSKRFAAIRPFMLLVGGIHLLYAVVLSVVVPLPAGAEPFIGIAFLSSFIRTGAIIILLDGLRHREVSTVIPIIYTYPMFVAVIAFLWLGERLAWQQWLAIGVIALGAVLISLNREPSRIQMGRPRSMLIVLASLLFALADVTGKVALEQLTFWHLFWIGAMVMGGVFLVVSLRPGVMRTIADLPGRGKTLAVVALNEVIAPVGIAISYWALQGGPVSLVSALLSTRPLFVLVFALLLSWWAPGFLFWSGGRRLVAVRVIATVMIVAGISVIEVS